MSDANGKPFGKQFNPRPDQILQSHESGVRSMVYGAHGIPYQPLHTLEEAKAYSDGIVVMEGDDGGTIYLVCPASLVTCSQDTLGELLSDLDKMTWNDLSMARVFYERQPVGTIVAGGSGGGEVTSDIWIHDEFVQGKVDAAIRAVIQGTLPNLPNEIRTKPLPGWQGTSKPSKDS
ncbi:MAG TPA: hypothetical protein VH590_13570 [Ktedonobacterales bacterium]|jgi:hypothetical protein